MKAKKSKTNYVIEAKQKERYDKMIINKKLARLTASKRR